MDEKYKFRDYDEIKANLNNQSPGVDVNVNVGDSTSFNQPPQYYDTGGYQSYGGYNEYNRYPNPPLSPDIDQDGKVSKLEANIVTVKYETQRRMAWVALVSMLIFTIILFLPIVSESRVSALSDLLGLFFIAQAGIVGSYMGFSSWMSRR